MRKGWSYEDVGLFMDQYLRNGKPLPKIEKCIQKDRIVELKVKSAFPIIRVQLNYTNDVGSCRERKWQSVDVEFDNSKLIKAELPDIRPIVYLLTVTDSRNATVSTEYESL